MKKKLLLILAIMTAALCGVFGFAACGDEKTESGTGDSNSSDTEQGGDVNNGDKVDENYTQGLEYEEDGSYYRVKGIGTASGTDIIIPSAYEGKQVTSIGERAFNMLTNLTSIELPDSVTSIGKQAFYGCSSLTKINLPDKITAINENAFGGCRSLTGLTIPEGVTSIGNGAFIGCSNLAKINLPEKITVINDNVFADCSSLTGITIPSGVTSIGAGAFSGCSNLTGITIPSGVTFINPNTFDGCSSLTSIEIPDGVTSIGIRAFYGCSFETVTIPEKVVSIGENAFAYCPRLAEITVCGDATALGHYAFYGSPVTKATVPASQIMPHAIPEEKLETFVIKGGNLDNLGEFFFVDYKKLSSVAIIDIASVPSMAFRECSALCKVTLGKSVTSIGSNAFYGCANIGEIKYEGDVKGWLSISGLEYLMLEGDENEKSLFIDGEEISGELIVPNTVTAIGSGAFATCKNLSSVTIPNTVTTIGDDVFYNTGLESITLPAFALNRISSKSLKTVVITGGTAIPEHAFEGCSNLLSITFPSGLTSIGIGAFYGCGSLISITLPSGLTSIGDWAFEGCESLKEITIPDSVTAMSYNTFSGCIGIENATLPAFATVHVPKNSLKTVVITGGDSIPANAFNGGSKIQDITVPDGITSVGNGAFKGCDSLNFNEYDNALYLGNTNNKHIVLVKAKNQDITSCNVNANTKIIYQNAFDGCRSLSDVSIPDGVLSIGTSAFNNCNSLQFNEYGNGLYLGNAENKYVVLMDTEDQYITSCNVNAATKIIYEKAFMFCRNLTDLVIPDGVISIGEQAFYYSGLTSIIISDNVTSVSRYAFGGCGDLTSITLPDGLTFIGDYAFSGCSGLTDITLPDGLTFIGDYAFSGCSGLTGITIPNSMTSINNSAFRDCGGLETIAVNKDNENYYSEGNCIIDKESKTLIFGCKNSVIPDDVTSIGSGAFWNCSDLTSITIPNSVTSIGNYAFFGCSGLTSITIPDSVTSIDYDVFNGCSGLISITIGKGVTSIGNYAFEGCGGLTSITIPDSVTSIGAGAFVGCGGLETITVGKDNKNYYSEGNCIIDKESKTLILGCKSSIIPDGVTSIADNAFDGCSDLTSITIPNSVTSIGGYAFWNCGSLSITFKGTKEQWNAIDKDDTWIDNPGYTVHCTDGDIQK